MAVSTPSINDLVELGRAALPEDMKADDGTLLLADLHACAIMGDLILQRSAQWFKNTFYGGARGDALDVLVRDRTKLERHDATKAVAVVTFTRASAAVAGNIQAGTEVVAETSAGRVSFVTTAALAFTSSQTSGSVLVQAVEAGSGGNVIAGAISAISGALFDTFTVTNADQAAGGNEREEDDAYVERAYNYQNTLRKGTIQALEFGALTVPAVRLVRARETETECRLVVSDENGTSNLQMVSDVEAVIDTWRAAGTNVVVYGGKAKLVHLSAAIYARTGFDIDTVIPTMRDAVSARIASLRPGDSLYLDRIIATIIGQYPDDIYDVTFTGLSVEIVGGQVTPYKSVDALRVVTPGDEYVLRPGDITLVRGT